MATVRVNADGWNTLNQSDRNQIEGILKKNRLLGANESIVPADVAIKEAGVQSAEGSLCKIACDAAEAAAIEACNKLSGPAKDLCIAAAKAAGDECRQNC
jgi:hypothetical protein